MKARALRITLGSLACLALLATFSTSGAQVPAPPEPQMAPLRPGALEPPPPGTGFIPPPMDLSHLTGQKMPGISAPQAPLSNWDWRTQGKVTPVRNQGGCGACYAFASIGNFESKMLIDGAGTYDFSENNAKECNWRELNNFQYPNPGDYWGSCDGGNYHMMASLFSQKGTVLESCDPYVASDVSCKSTCSYQKTLLDWRIISGDAVPNTNVLKQYIYDYGPVYTALYAGYYDAWDTEFGNYDGSYTLYHAGSEDPNHAVLIVGWDDSLSHAGPGSGGWVVKNSWGTGWGDSGYFYIAYGSASIGTSSSFIHEWQDYDTNGDLWYYDEDGWWGSWGYSDTTAWGLVKFIPSSDTNVTRVEFWTTDETTDVDVYIYDNFNGTTLSNLLTSKENNSFGEAGYHSVALDSPLAVTSGDDVIAVVKFTNASYGYPIATDPHGTVETGRTYMSHSGSWWSDMGVTHSTDAAIRLRTSTSVAPAPTVTSITPSSGFNTGVVHITNLAGSDFQSGATVKLTKSDQSNINATGVIVDSASKITCYLDLTGAASGQWNVVVTNPDSQTNQLDNGFTVNVPPAPDVSITKRTIGHDFSPGDSITFTLTIANSGNKTATQVVVTDILPIQVLTPAFASTLAITLTGSPPPYKWNVEPLGIGASGVITIYGQINPGLPSGFAFVNRATIWDPEDNTPGNNTSLVIVGGHKVYLPLALRI